jgi:hypothetical protein
MPGGHIQRQTRLGIDDPVGLEAMTLLKGTDSMLQSVIKESRRCGISNLEVSCYL